MCQIVNRTHKGQTQWNFSVLRYLGAFWQSANGYFYYAIGLCRATWKMWKDRYVISPSIPFRRGFITRFIWFLLDDYVFLTEHHYNFEYHPSHTFSRIRTLIQLFMSIFFFTFRSIQKCPILSHLHRFYW